MYSECIQPLNRCAMNLFIYFCCNAQLLIRTWITFSFDYRIFKHLFQSNNVCHRTYSFLCVCPLFLVINRTKDVIFTMCFIWFVKLCDAITEMKIFAILSSREQQLVINFCRINQIIWFSAMFGTLESGRFSMSCFWSDIKTLISFTMSIYTAIETSCQ